MSKDPKASFTASAPDASDGLAALPFNRRALLGGMGLAAASPFAFSESFAKGIADPELIQQTKSEHARPESHPKEVFNLPRWKPKMTGNFDLTKVRDNHFAFAKAQVNLAGEYSWFAQYGWNIIAPPGKPAYPFLGRMKLGKLFVTPTEVGSVPDVGPDDYTIWATHSEAFFDPRTFEPIERILNPHTGKMIDIPVIHYADRIVFRLGKPYAVPGVNPDFYAQQWDRDSGFSQHYIDVGDEVTYTFLGASQFDGPHQPRCDVGFWTVKTAELMDPKVMTIDCRRDYSVIQRMSEYKLYGAPKGDQAQIFGHTTGIKTESLARVPELVKKGILYRFQDRFA